MVETQLNIFDSAVLVVIFLSTLMAFFRGFVKEVLSLGAWVGSALITLYFFPDVASWLKPHFKNPIVATGFATLGTYITALVSISIVNSIILRYVKAGSDVGMLDNMLGLVFGFARGAFIVSLGFLMMTFVVNKENYPIWVEEAITRPYVEHGAETLAKLAPRYLSDSEQMNKILGARAHGDSDSDTGADAGRNGDKGYSTERMKELDRLIDSATQTPTSKE